MGIIPSYKLYTIYNIIFFLDSRKEMMQIRTLFCSSVSIHFPSF